MRPFFFRRDGPRPRAGPLGSTSQVEREAVIAILRQALEPVVVAEGMDLVDLQWHRRGPRWVLTLFIERPAGVTLDDCARISRQVAERIEVDSLIDHAYTLEVSSPGLDRPLRTLADFTRFQGHLVRIVTTMPIQGRSTFVGRLQGVGEESVLVEAQRLGTVPIPVTQIKHARLEIEF